MSLLSNNVHTGLFVENVEKMVSFYRDILGLETEWDGGPFASFKINNGGLFMFDRKQFAEDIKQSYYANNGLNLTMEVCFNLTSKTEVDSEFARIKSLGAHVLLEPEDQPWGQRNCWFADPEGNLIEIGAFN